MLGDISMTSFRLLNNDLRVEDYPEARHEKTAHEISKAEHGPAHHPAHQMVHGHRLHHSDNDSTEEEERAPLRK